MSSYYSDGRGRTQQQGKQGKKKGTNNPQRSRPQNGRPQNGGKNNRKKKTFNPLPLLLVLLLVIGIVAAVQWNKAQQEQKAQDLLNTQQEQQQQTEDELLNAQTIYSGVSINSISLAGMTKEEAIKAVEEELGLAEHTITLNYNEQSFPVALMTGSDLASIADEAYQVGRQGTREENLSAISALAADPVDFTVEAGYSLPDMVSVLQNCALTINQPALDATVTGFKTSDSSFTYEEGQPGVEVDVDATLAAAQAVVTAGNYDANVSIVVTQVQPAMDKATLKSKFQRLATYTTTTTSNSNRNTNIKLCSASISGAVVKQGAEFSLNSITGERTASKGYLDATVIKNGVYIQEPGGGVCQVSSTLFNAVVRSGLTISERHNHSIISSYVPIGEDAAIDYPHKDFKFINNSQGPVAVVLTFDQSNKKLKASVYGIPILESGVTLDLTSEETKSYPIPEPTYTEDPTLLYGEEVEITTGLEGKRVTTYLITKKDGKQISKVEQHKSSYPKRTPVIAINSSAIPSGSPIPQETPDTGIPGDDGGNTDDDQDGHDGFVIPEE